MEEIFKIMTTEQRLKTQKKLCEYKMLADAYKLEASITGSNEDLMLHKKYANKCYKLILKLATQTINK